MDKRILEMCREIDEQKLATAQEGVTAWAEKLLEDAERYRWLREQHTNWVQRVIGVPIGPRANRPELLDAAIDAEMEKDNG